MRRLGPFAAFSVYENWSRSVAKTKRARALAGRFSAETEAALPIAMSGFCGSTAFIRSETQSALG